MDKTDPRWRNSEMVPYYFLMRELVRGDKENEKQRDREKSCGGRERTENIVLCKYRVKAR